MFVLAVSVQTGAYRLSQSRSLGSFRHPALSPSASPLMVLLEPEILEPGKSSKTPTIADECVGDRTVTAQSYREQFDELFAKPLRTSQPVSKPSNEAQQLEPTARRVPFSNVFGTLCRRPGERPWTQVDWGRTIWFTVAHSMGVLAWTRFFTWRMLGLHFLVYCACGMGITYSYHRQLAHRSFKSPKWLEYMAAYCGMMAVQGSPIDWVSDHRYHHLHTETPLDPHSSYEGFYWSHLGWMLDSKVYEQRCGNQGNVADLSKQPFYQHTHEQYGLHLLASMGLVYALGGVAGIAWRCFFLSLLYHVTWFVNSASHLWGRQEYQTGDQSRNNWWVGFLAFGEGWHNNHHAFEYSARHGLRPRQFDITWQIIRLFQRVGLVSAVKLPTEAAKDRLRLEPAGA